MPQSEQTAALVEEQLSVEKRDVVTGRVRVRTQTEVLVENLRVDLDRDDVEITRVPIDRIVDAAPAVRTEGLTTVIPVMEERLVVERRLVLVEELHVTRRTTTTPTEIPVSRRKQHAVVDRLPPNSEDQS